VEQRWKDLPSTPFSILCLNVQGMVGPGENVSDTLKREFLEEADDHDEGNKAAAEDGKNDRDLKLKRFLSCGGVEVCQSISRPRCRCTQTGRPVTTGAFDGSASPVFGSA